MQYEVSPEMLLIFAVISGIVGYAIGTKKRIGFGWSFFFTFFWIVPGIVFSLLSPPLKKLPPPNPKDKTYNNILGIVALLSAIGLLYSALTTPEYARILREDSLAYQILTMVYFGGAAYYMFTRLKRHQRIYEEQMLKKSDVNLPNEEQETNSNGQAD